MLGRWEVGCWGSGVVPPPHFWLTPMRCVSGDGPVLPSQPWLTSSCPGQQDLRQALSHSAKVRHSLSAGLPPCLPSTEGEVAPMAAVPSVAREPGVMILSSAWRWGKNLGCYDKEWPGVTRN